MTAKAAKRPKCIVTEEHRDQFAAAVEYWRDQLGLQDWRIVVSELRSSRNVMAEVYKFDLGQRSATIRVGKDWGHNPVTERAISDTALHECLHVFLFEVLAFAQANASDEDTDSAEHRVINVLERVLGPLPFERSGS
jgi:hypothetical protein